MKRLARGVGLALAAVVLLGMAGMAQEVQPPFTWKGKGVATTIEEFGTDDTNFDFTMSVDASGIVKGQASTNEGEVSVKHLFYSEKTDYSFPEGFNSRLAIIVLIIDEESDNPMICVLKGRVLLDRFFYGEICLVKYEKDSDVAKGLEIGNDMATPIDEEFMPSELKAALKKCTPFGTVQIKGEYEK